MMQLKTIPAIDNYETTLAQEWNGNVGNMKVDDLPDIPVGSDGKFENGITTIVIVNPDKVTAQAAEIDGYNSVDSTLSVKSVTLLKGFGKNFTIKNHPQKSIVRISNNFAFWNELKKAIDSKQDYGNGTIEGQNYTLDIVGGDLSFRDKNNAIISLSDITQKVGVDKKVSITGTDTPNYLQNKLHKGFIVEDVGSNKKVSVDATDIDFNRLANQSLSQEDFIILANNKKAQLSSLKASDSDIEARNSNKFATAEQVKKYNTHKIFIGSVNMQNNGNTEQIVLTHNLGVVPSFIELEASFSSYKIGDNYYGISYITKGYKIDGTEQCISYGYSGTSNSYGDYNTQTHSNIGYLHYNITSSTGDSTTYTFKVVEITDSIVKISISQSGGERRITIPYFIKIH